MIRKHKYQNWLHSCFVPCDWCLLAPDPDLVIIGSISHNANCISLLFNPIRCSCVGKVGCRGGTYASYKVACLCNWQYAGSHALSVVYSVPHMSSLGRTLPLPFFPAMIFLHFMESYNKQVKWNTIMGNIYWKVLKNILSNDE